MGDLAQLQVDDAPQAALDRAGAVERGTHAELVAAAGLYAELYRMQARAYR